MTVVEPANDRRQSAPIAPRFVVVQAEGPLGHHELEAACGTSLWVRENVWYVTIIVKLALERRADGLLVPAGRASFFVDTKHRFESPDDTLLDHGNDFAPFKEDVDVAIVGHARSRVPGATIPASLRIVSSKGEVLFGTAVEARAGAAATKIPLAPPYLASDWAGATARTTAAADPARGIEGNVGPKLDTRLFQVASTQMRLARGVMRGDEALEIAGFLEGEAVLQLPALYPFVTYDIANGPEGTIVDMSLDGLHIDTDTGLFGLAWQGLVGPLYNPESVRRFVVSIERFLFERGTPARLADTQRGVVRFAWTEEDARASKAPPQDDPVLELHRYLTFGEVAPEPRIPIERYSLMSALLSEWPSKREETLKKHGFTEESWLVEERCWLERFAADAVNGKGELAAYHGELFIIEQDMLATPEEVEFTMRDYIGVRVAMEVGGDVAEVLAQAKMTLPQWMRLDRRFTALADEDPAVRHEMDAMEATLLAEAEADLEAREASEDED